MKNRVGVFFITILLCLVSSSEIRSINLVHIDSYPNDSTYSKRDTNSTVSELKTRNQKLLTAKNDTLLKIDIDTIADKNQLIDNKANKKEKKLFYPSPQKAMWYGLILPGLGQIYNRKYWKVPIVYGGFAGLAYGISWNDRHYRLYKQYYRDMTDSNPDTKSYEELYETVGQSVVTETLIKNSMDNLRRARDLFIIGSVAFYAVTVLDAFVDASLANFDISPDLSMKIAPTMIQTHGKSVNLAVRLNFNF